METVEYRITEGSNYNAYGGSYSLESWNGDQDGHSFSIIFSTDTQEVFEVQAHDYQNARAYRWITENWRKDSDIDHQAWDNVNYTTLEMVEDFFDKMSAIYKGEEYDTRVCVPVEFTDEELLKYMKIAHEQDITFNQLVEKACRFAIDDFQKDPEGYKKKQLEFSRQNVETI